MIKYQLRADRFCNEDNISYTGYGIDIYEKQKCFSIKDITTNKEDLISLIEKCNRLKLSVIHINDVVRDFLN